MYGTRDAWLFRPPSSTSQTWLLSNVWFVPTCRHGEYVLRYYELYFSLCSCRDHMCSLAASPTFIDLSTSHDKTHDTLLESYTSSGQPTRVICRACSALTRGDQLMLPRGLFPPQDLALDQQICILPLLYALKLRLCGFECETSLNGGHNGMNDPPSLQLPLPDWSLMAQSPGGHHDLV